MITATEETTFVLPNGQEIRMGDIVEFEIKPEHIAKGKRGEGRDCPAYHALAELYGENVVSVGGLSVYVYLPLDTLCFQQGDALRQAIREYDVEGREFLPGRYSMTLIG